MQIQPTRLYTDSHTPTRPAYTGLFTVRHLWRVHVRLHKLSMLVRAQLFRFDFMKLHTVSNQAGTLLEEDF